MNKSLLVLLFILLIPASAAAHLPDSLRAKLQELDAAIENHTSYCEAREALAAKLKIKALKADETGKISIYKQLTSDYLHIQTDSAYNYLQRLASLGAAQTDKQLQNYINIARAQYYTVTGQYAEALQLADSIDRQTLDEEQRLYYYRTLRTMYGWMANYATVPALRQQYALLTQNFRDSILLLEPAGNGRNVVLADRALSLDNAQEALRLSLSDLNDAKHPPMVYTYYNLAECFRLLGNRHGQAYYLAETALIDMKTGVREYQALPQLAQLLLEYGDVERAYTYLARTLEDAAYCKAALRSVEASAVFPIVDKVYKQQQQEQRQTEHLFFSGIVLLALLLITAVAHLLRQKKELWEAREELTAANQQLQVINNELTAANENIRKVNAELLLTDKMKEEYIARYLDRCRNYLDALDNYRRSLLKAARSDTAEALQKKLKSEAWLKEEKTRFYTDFDQAFLNLFPHFIERFNELLLPTARITLREGELLNTELRIFALIRLGVSESKHIAHFLDYSLPTVYSYRSRLRNRAACPKEEFEQRVMEL